MREFTLKKNQKLLNKIDYLSLKKLGKKKENNDFIIIYNKNNKQNSRLGLTVSKRVGCAVIRNRIKRVSREYFRKNRVLSAFSFDINIIAKPYAAKKTNKELFESLDLILNKIGN